MTPGEIYELKVELKYLSYLVPAGHRVRVSLSSADFINAWPAGRAAVNRVHRGSRYLSRIVLPVAPEQNPKLPAPEFAPSPHPLPNPAALQKPVHRITQDLVSQTTTYSCQEQRPANESFESSVTISHLDPANVVVKVTYTCASQGPGCQIQVSAHSITASDAGSFRHIVSVHITVDGKPFFDKSWNVQVPRLLN
jgi:hypothetical protein